MDDNKHNREMMILSDMDVISEDSMHFMFVYLLVSFKNLILTFEITHFLYCTGFN